MTRTERYVRKHLGEILEEVRATITEGEVPILDIYERTIIYNYTKEGYEEMNGILRKTPSKLKTFARHSYKVRLRSCLTT